MKAKTLSFFILTLLLLAGLTVADGEASAKKLDAPHIKQMPELPRGCEVTSLSMLLQDQGVNVGKMQLAKEVKKVPFKTNGVYGNPYDGFVGNMYTYGLPGLGVYHGPIFDLANKYLPGKVVDFTGSSPSAIYKAIDMGSPVWVITNTQFKQLPSSYFQTWNTSSGNLKITYKEHSVLVTGYDSQYVYINDPLYNKKNRAVPRKNFEASWIQMGSQAIAAIPKADWAKELSAGQIGKLTIMKPITLWDRTSTGLKAGRVLQPFETLKVCGYDGNYGGQYKLCGGGYVTNMAGYIRYETPPSSMLQERAVADAQKVLAAAKSYAGSLKWEIQADYRKGKYPGNVAGYPNMTYFNKTKEYMNLSQGAIGRVGDAVKKQALQNELNADVMTYYKRAVGYIDAVTSGKKLVDMAHSMDAAVMADPLGDAGEAKYHQLSAEVRKNAVLLYRVYGQSTREAVLAAYKKPAEDMIAKHRYTVTAKMMMDDFKALDQAKVAPEEYNQRAAELKAVVGQIKDAGVRERFLAELK